MTTVICPDCGNELGETDWYSGSNYYCRACQDLVIPKIVEEVFNIERNDNYPHCFSYHDGRDGSCRRCGVKKQCEAEFIRTRPECFGLEYGNHAECDDCLDSSQCIEHQKELTKMAARKRTTTRRRRRKAEEVVEEPQVAEEEIIEEDDDEDNGDDYNDWSVPDLRKELEARELDPKGRKSVLVKRLLADDAKDDEEEEDEEEEEEAPVQVKRTRTRVRKAKAEEPVVADEPVLPAVAEISTAAATPLSELTMAIINQLNAGQTVSVTAMPNGYNIVLGGVAIAAPVAEETIAAAPKGKGLRGDDFYQEVWTPEYWAFMKEDAGNGTPWEELEADDKYELADELDLEWDEHDDSKVDMMRLVKALFAEKDIVKYKEEYRSPAARKALR